MVSVGIIGAGAAGMMAALSAARNGADVTVLERSSAPGAKILVTGGGRCNFSHECEPRDFVAALGRRGRFLGHALAALGPAETRNFFASIGVMSLIEPDGRVVPVSQRAVDVRRALVEAMAVAGVSVICRSMATSISFSNGRWLVECDGGAHAFDSLVIAAGGMSYPATGSDGSGFDLARLAGHTVLQPLPAEVPLVTAGIPLDRLQGLTVDDVNLSIAGSRQGRTRGGLLFTHFGISGPAVLDISGDVSEALHRGVSVTVLADLVPGVDDDVIDSALATGIPGLRGLVPSRLAALVAEMAAAATPGTAGSLVRRFPIRVTRTRGFEHSMVTRGGIDLKEVEPSSMQSRLAKGLFFAGEILDLDGPMGGYNLQVAWSTGWLAGRCAATV